MSWLRDEMQECLLVLLEVYLPRYKSTSMGKYYVQYIQVNIKVLACCG
jgi:hypothetical protein